MRKKILLVEDEALIALQEAKLLEQHGYRVVTVYNGREAVKTAVNDAEIDLILMDIDLGSGMDGTEAAARILEQRELPVVFLTSHAEKEMVERVKDITRYGYVLKNSGEFVLIESINMAFELFEARLRSKEKERELEEANKLKRLILDSTSELFAFYDTDFRIKWANRAAADSVGQHPKELLGKFCYEVWQQRGEPCEQCPLIRVIETGEPQEAEQTTPDGREWLLRGYPVIEGGEITGLVEFGQDVTPRREAERGMLKSEERYRILYNTISDAIILVDNDRKITHCNPAFTELFGYTLDEVRGTATSVLYADMDEFRELGKAMKEHSGEKHFRYTLRYRKKNGEEFKGEKNVHYLRGSSGELTGYIGVIREVSEQRFTEERLRESERKYAELFEYAPVVMWEEDFSGVKEYLDELRESGVENLREYLNRHPEALRACAARIEVTNINRETMQLMAVSSKEEVLGSLEKTFTDASLEMLKKELLAVWNGETIAEDTGTIRTPSGEEKEIILRFQILPGYKETLSKVILSFIDITRRVRAEEEMIESERQYRELYHSIRDAIIVVDENRTITHCNPAFTNLFGYTLEEISGESTAILFENEEEFAKLGERMAESSREPNFYYTVRYRKKNGEVFIGEKNIHFLRDGKGTLRGFIGVIRDVTARIRSEEQVQQLLNEKQMLLREVHHRIKNDMSSISSLLSLQSSALTNPEAVNALQEAQNRISLMSNIYDTLYKAEGYRTIPIHDFLETIIENIRRSYEGFSNISIQTDFEDITVPAKQAFPIGIILNELIANAYKYAFSGVEQGRIHTSLCEREGKYLEIRVEDNGVGFPDEVTRDGQYGFGLTLVEAFSQQYDGNFYIEQNDTNIVSASLKIAEQ
jgi:PAS domain S-box-containing protein